MGSGAEIRGFAETALAARIDVRGLLHPQSVAVIGAAESDDKWGGRVLRYLIKHGYDGRIVPVTPRAGVVQGLEAAPNIAEAPTGTDVAIIVVPAEQAVEAVRECAEAGVGACIIISAQFAEVGAEGARRQERIVHIARSHGMRLLGPNCLGIVNPHERLAMSSSLSLGQLLRLPAGAIGLASQSGALMGSLISRAYDMGAGFSSCISVGNQCDLELCDFFEYFIDDSNTQVICLYVEGFLAPARFEALAERARSRGKPVLVTKAGRTESGTRAVQSHTASLAGAHDVFAAVCEAYGVLLVDDVFDMLALAEAIVRMGRLSGDGIAVFSGSGGGGALLIDALGDHGLRPARISAATRRRLEAYMPETHRELPLDLGVVRQTAGASGASDAAGAALATVMDDADVAAGVFMMTTQPSMEDTARTVARVGKRSGKPIFFVNVAGAAGNKARAALAESRFLSFEHPNDALRALGRLGHAWRTREGSGPAPVVPLHLDDLIRSLPRGLLTETEAKRLVAAAGVPITRERLARSRTVAAAAARELGFPVALKVQARGLAHKSDIGGLKLGLASIDAVVASFGELRERVAAVKGVAFDGCLVQEMVAGDVELLVGTRWDTQFGAVVAVGIGGTLVELLGDVKVALAPVTPAQAERLLGQLRLAPLLRGYRGRPPVALEVVARIVADLSQVAANLGPRLAELEINPLIVAGDRAIAADARAVLLNDWELPAPVRDA
jgi:acetyl-CoA synthetase (ADP-forming)